MVLEQDSEPFKSSENGEIGGIIWIGLQDMSSVKR